MENRSSPIVLAAPDVCTGCGACANICPYQALSMQEGKYGFVEPQINATLCVACRKCESVCPVLHPPLGNSIDLMCYAVWAEPKVRDSSSSGGVFSVLAEHILQQGGVVFGAALDEKLCLRHVSVQTIGNLEALRGSKYVQSDIGDAYREAECFLREGRKVLFSGCPCHIAALRSYLAKENEGLITVDMLCHGVPSQKMLRDYLAEHFDVEKIKNISFRNKAHGWVCNTLTVLYKDGSQEVIPYEKSVYEQVFHTNVSMRESCYDCPFCGEARQGDITLGDFWGIEGFQADWNDSRGTSLVFVNTPTGQRLFDAVKAEFIRCQQVPAQYGCMNRLREKIDLSPVRDRFLRLLEKYSFSKAADYALHKKYDVGVIGCWSVENHGSNMTYYALYRVLCDMGLEPLMIERPLDSLWPPHEYPEGFLVNPYSSWALSPLFPDKSAMKALNNQCDTFLLGSDQLLYHDLYHSFSEFIDMRYIHANKRKLAYATSLGRDTFEGTEDQRASLSLWLQQFDAISVREESGVNALKQIFGVTAQYVLDPVFLCPVQVYDDMASLGTPVSSKPYLSAYVLDPTSEKEEALRFLASEKGVDLCVFSDVAHTEESVKKAWSLPTDITATNETWLRSIRDCDFFITDSFHGVCFAIIFHKPFICIANLYRGITRFTSLLSELGLMERMVTDASQVFNNNCLVSPIDYDRVDNLLNKRIDDSRTWLKQAINTRERKPFSFFDVLDKRLDSIQIELQSTQSQFQTHEGQLSYIEPWLLTLDSRINTAQELASNSQERQSSLEVWTKALDERLQQAQQVLANSQEKQSSLEVRIKTLDERLQQAQQVLANSQEKQSSLEVWIKALDERLQQVQQVLADSQEKQSNLELWTKVLDERHLQTQQAMVNFEEKQSNLEMWAKTMNEQMVQYQQALILLQQQLSSIQAHSQNLESGLADMQATLRSLSEQMVRFSQSVFGKIGNFAGKVFHYFIKPRR